MIPDQDLTNGRAGGQEHTMNSLAFSFAGEDLQALPSGALWWPGARILCISDLHLGKSERIARRTGALIPPYEAEDTLNRLQSDLAATSAARVVALGDSFDDMAAAGALSGAVAEWIACLQAGREWIWIAGNHDPAPLALGGSHRTEAAFGALTFRHAAATGAKPGEVSGHYHPKARVALRGRNLSRACFLVDDRRLILPAYGTYTGGLRSSDAALAALMAEGAEAILTGPCPSRIPMPR